MDSQDVWYPWFAWHPVQVDAFKASELRDWKIAYYRHWKIIYYVWLRRVEYRLRHITPRGDVQDNWQYRLPQL